MFDLFERLKKVNTQSVHPNHARVVNNLPIPNGQIPPAIQTTNHQLKHTRMKPWYLIRPPTFRHTAPQVSSLGARVESQDGTACSVCALQSSTWRRPTLATSSRGFNGFPSGAWCLVFRWSLPISLYNHQGVKSPIRSDQGLLQHWQAVLEGA